MSINSLAADSSSASSPPRTGQAGAAGTWSLSPIGFSVGILLVSLYLQRFALPAGGGLKISVATPLGFLLVLLGLASGSLAFDRRRFSLLLGLAAVALMAYAFQVNLPLAMAPRSSLVSAAYWIAVTGFATLRFARSVDEDRLFRVVNAIIVSIAIAGLIQFAAQFAGLSIFSFKGIVPDKLLLEEQFNVASPFSLGLMRANGFFLVEPSVFSQFVAVGIIVELVYFRRIVPLAILFAALLASASGTGWLILGSFGLAAAVTRGKSGIVAAASIALLTVGVLAGVTLAAPSVTERLQERAGEFWQPGTSGHERFVTPFMLLHDVVENSSRVLVTGLGPGASEAVGVPYKYDSNAPVKVVLEYGVLGLGLYIALFLTARRSARQALLVCPLMVFLLFSGGNQLFAPVLFPVLLLVTVSSVREGKEAASRARAA